MWLSTLVFPLSLFVLHSFSVPDAVAKGELRRLRNPSDV